MTRITSTAFVTARSLYAAASVGNYALFGGGSDPRWSPSQTTAVDAYDVNLTRSTPANLSYARYSSAATSVGGYALIGGGAYYTGTIVTLRVTNVDAYDANLTRSIPTALGEGRSNLAAATIGDYALFAGGYTNKTTVDVYMN